MPVLTYRPLGYLSAKQLRYRRFVTAKVRLTRSGAQMDIWQECTNDRSVPEGGGMNLLVEWSQTFEH